MMFVLYNSFSQNLQKIIEKSKEYIFYKIVFCNTDENMFKRLYSDKKSYPNAFINNMITSLILIHRYNWTYEELFKQIRFYILTKLFLGLDFLVDKPFCTVTLFNFQNRLNKHFIKTGKDLMERVFDKLTEKQIKALKIKTNIQRIDLFAAALNIRNYSRLQLLIKLVLRIYRVLSEKEEKRFIKQFKLYINKTSEQSISSIGAQYIPHEIEKIAQLYYWLDQIIKLLYKEMDIFKTFERAYAEQFIVSEQKIGIKPDEPILNYFCQLINVHDAISGGSFL